MSISKTKGRESQIKLSRRGEQGSTFKRLTNPRLSRGDAAVQQRRPVSLNWCQSRLALISAVIPRRSAPSVHLSTVRAASPPGDTRLPWRTSAKLRRLETHRVAGSAEKHGGPPAGMRCNFSRHAKPGSQVPRRCRPPPLCCSRDVRQLSEVVGSEFEK